MLKPVYAADFDYIYDLYFHPQINPYLLYEMMDKQAFQPIFDDLLARGILYIFKNENQNIGMFKFIPLEHRNNHMAYLGGVAIHPEFAGKGYGKLMFEEIIALGKLLGLKRIELSTATTNEKAMHLYEKMGFQKEGVLRKYTYLKSENRFLDEVMMSYLY